MCPIQDTKTKKTDPFNKDEQMPILDTKHLLLVGDVWYFDFRVPAKLRKFFKVDRVRQSLNTADYKQAKFNGISI